jgi:hypothetical protein
MLGIELLDLQSFSRTKNIPKILDFTQNILTLQYGRSQKGLNNGLRVKLTVAIDSPPQNT